MKHFSQRLGRPFQDGDWLTRGEVAAVIAANSGKPLPQDRFVSDIAKREGWHPDTTGGRYAALYQYSEVKSFVLGKPGRRPSPNPSAAAIRQQKYKAKKLAEQERC